MKGCLIVNAYLRSAKFNELEEMFQEAARTLGIDLKVIKNDGILVKTGTGKETTFPFMDGERPDFVLFWDKDVLLAQWLEDQGICVYNRAVCIALCDDKRKMHLALERANVPTPETEMAPMTYSGIGYTNFHFLDDVEKALGYPLIVKEAYGSFGAQVYKVDDREGLEAIVDKNKNGKLLFQRFIAASEGRDVRIQVVGNRVVASMYRYSTNDFRANITAGGSMKPYEPTKEEKELAICAASAVGADFAGVDLLFGEGGPLVCEVNSNAHFKNLYECTGCNTAYEILQYIREEYWKKRGRESKCQAWLIYDKKGAERNREYIRMHEETAKKYGVTCTLLYAEEIKKALPENKPDFAIVRTIAPDLSQELEEKGIPVFNSSIVSQICNDKGKTIEYVKKNTDVPVIPTETFLCGELSKELMRTHPDCVVKAVDGHGGEQVFKTEEPFEQIKKKIGSSNFIIQPFIKGRGKDIRVYLVGNEIVGAVERTAADGFRSNFSLGGKVNTYRLKEKEREMVKKISNLFSFGMAGIDFIVDEDGHLIFNEIEDVVGARMLYTCNPQINLLDRYFCTVLDILLQ